MKKKEKGYDLDREYNKHRYICNSGNTYLKYDFESGRHK